MSTDILLCNSPLSANQLHAQCGLSIEDLTAAGCRKPTTALSAYTPYLATKSPSVMDRSTISVLTDLSAAKSLTEMALTYGENRTLAMMELASKLHDAGISTLGASTSVYGERMQGFAQSVQQYQTELLAYRTATKKDSATRRAAEQKVLASFSQMQTKFRLELESASAQTRHRQKGSPFNNPNRALNIARDSRNTVRLRLRDQLEAQKLAQFAKHTKLLGNGLVVIDFGARIGNIHTAYQADADWHRELFVESSSFTASAVTGVATAKVGAAALGFLVAATPVGWVGLVVGGAVVAGASAVSTIAMNQAIKDQSGGWYDSIMNWIRGE